MYYFIPTRIVAIEKNISTGIHRSMEQLEPSYMNGVALK